MFDVICPEFKRYFYVKRSDKYDTCNGISVDVSHTWTWINLKIEREGQKI